jgi:molybdopterin-containing oxidoreductase family iron-sulfur binding subunit
MDRPIIRETTLGHFVEYTKELQHERTVLKQHAVNLYPLYERGGHNWAMAIDLNKCTGCGACVVSCQSENNIPVVGKDEVRRGREMHWMRIDRYYSADATDPELANENPEVVFQPMLCQHCDNAPCENVCPVLATVHSSEGLNQQAYNRCFGTRYCANNCPYKVRRFNWLDYTEPKNFIYNPVDNIGRMVLNPDVTVRARGVMEKCSFCVQRLQSGKLAAKADGRKLQDSDVQTACSKSCPAGAIVFGDVNDPESAISKYYNDERTYFALEELKVLPSVAYKVKVRNKVKEETAKA